MNFISNWLAYITKKGDESKSFPIQQFEMNGRVGDAYVVSPYGVHANLPEGQPALNMSPDGTILMGIDPVGRIKVEAGEVVFYHPITKSKIHFKNNKDIDIETETDINASCANANINASVDINATASGDINAVCDNLNASATTKATVTAPDIELAGNVVITGTLDVGGLAGFNGGIEANGTNIDDTHAHSGVTVGPSGTGGVI